MMKEIRNDIDDDGRCCYHPQIHLQRKLSSGGWREVLSKCPLCSISAVHPRRDVSKVRSRTTIASCSPNSLSLQDPLPKSGVGAFVLDKDFSNMSLASTDMTVSSTSASSISSASEEQTTASSATSSFRSVRRSSAAITKGVSLPTTASTTSSTARPAAYKRVACGMSYLCPETNCVGFYTGQLHPEKQIPHGIGCLRYKDGTRAEGEWFNGLLPPAAGDSSHSLKRNIKRTDAESSLRFHSLPPIDNGNKVHQTEDDLNSLEDNDDYSIVSKGDLSTYSHETKRTHYSAREVKSTLPPLRNSSLIVSSRSYLDKSFHDNMSTGDNNENRRAFVRSYVETKKGRVNSTCQDLRD